MSGTGGAGDISGAAIGAARVAFEAERDAAAGEQPGLPIDLSDSEGHHALPDAGEVLAIQEELGCGMMEAVREQRRRAGLGGRKKGARNKRTEDFGRYLLQFGPHPGITLMRIQGRPTDMLATELGCDKLTAAQLQVKAAAEVLPYIESKMPVKADVAVSGAVTWIEERSEAMIDGGMVDGATGEPMLRLDGETTEIQGFAGDDGESSE